MALFINLSGACLILLNICEVLKCEQILNTQNDDFDFDGLPGVTYEFKVEILSGEEQCFYQKIAQGASLHVSYEVLRGGDRLVDLYVYNAFRDLIDEQHSKPAGTVEKKADIEGIYSVCIYNTGSGSKLVYFYMVTYVMEDWDKYLKEIEGLTSTVTNFTETVTAVAASVELVKQHQAASRMNVIKDWYLVTGNYMYVLRWSIFQICITICTSVSQVFILRRLFKSRIATSTPTHKPRA